MGREGQGHRPTVQVEFRMASWSSARHRKVWPADLVLLAMGFVPGGDGARRLWRRKGTRGNARPRRILTAATPPACPKVFAAGDIRRGQSLVGVGHLRRPPGPPRPDGGRVPDHSRPGISDLPRPSEGAAAPLVSCRERFMALLIAPMLCHRSWISCFGELYGRVGVHAPDHISRPQAQWPWAGPALARDTFQDSRNQFAVPGAGRACGGRFPASNCRGAAWMLPGLPVIALAHACVCGSGRPGRAHAKNRSGDMV